MLKKFAATTSTAAVAIGMLAAGAGVAAAQDEGEAPTGSMSSGSLGLDLEDTAGDLQLAAQALNGPVSVEPGSEEGGPSVTFANEGEDATSCVGFTMPYSTIEENDIDPNAIDLSDLLGALELLGQIQDGGDVSVLDADEDGDPAAHDATEEEGIVAAALALLGGGGVTVDAGEEVTWASTNPTEEPAAAAVICTADGLEGLEVNFGIDKQVVADQINDKIPGGSIAPVGPGSISGGSVELGAGALGSLAGGDDEGEEPTDPEEPTAPAE
ncbi:hypothetical protein [Dietzia timorensis]|uniref:Uncharacterized protein n=1 Tax=Dietzia timorensis TaxID=499555 RepID=A0A173LR93_9ACTN|nr:hypothetical protein [Dietzia timorensis]ANI93350.1 Hypothetical protein BJL86_2590 [Dietzia timorensis]